MIVSNVCIAIVKILKDNVLNRSKTAVQAEVDHDTANYRKKTDGEKTLWGLFKVCIHLTKYSPMLNGRTKEIFV